METAYTCLTLTLTLGCKNICQYGVIVRSRSSKQTTENYINLEFSKTSTGKYILRA